jgi:hypothetical protein
MRTRIGLCAVLTALAVSCAPTALAQAPQGDNYLDSLGLNAPGERLDRTNTLGDQRDTSNFTVQSDLFNPDQSGGPAEPTTCQGANVGKTVWYDVYPDVAGLVRLRASGYNTFLAMMPFNRRTFVPDLGARDCYNGSDSTTEEFFFPVSAGRSYTIQVGGVDSAGGNLEFLFDFLADTDGDGVLDGDDECRTLAGPSGRACPTRLNANATLRALPTSNGLEVVSLAVTAPRRSRVAVSCSRGCRQEVKRARSTVNFRRIRGASLAAGSKIVIRVTRRRSFGVYIVYKIRPGNFQRVERCLNPGSRKPRKRCG